MSSIQKVASDSWRVRYRADGKQYSVTFVSKKDALYWQKQLDALGPVHARAILNSPVTSTVTLSEHLENHIERLTGVEDGHRKVCRAYITNHMSDIGTIPLGLINREVISKWVNSLAKKGLSGKSIANIHGFLSSGLNTAVADKLMSDNPSKGIKLPRTQKDEKVFLSKDEFADLYDLIPQFYQPFVLCLVGTGMRFSEARAFTVADLDIEAGSIHIRQAWKHTATSEKKLGVPKTARGLRTVSVPRPVLDLLIPVVANKKATDFVFTTQTGKIITQQYFAKVWGEAVQKWAGDTVTIKKDKSGRNRSVVVEKGSTRRPTPHDLRHTFASWAIRSGVPLPVIQRQLGHQSITTTIDTYGHLARADFDALALATTEFLPSVRAIEG